MFWLTRDRRRAGAGDPVVAFGIALIALSVSALAPQLLNDGDTFWHIRAGEWMLDHRAVLTFDPFSFTFAGKPWLTEEWLSEIIFALAYRVGGWSAVVLLTASAFAAASGLLAWHLSRFLSRTTTVIACVLALASVSASLLARPHMLALPVLELWTASLVIARSRKSAPSLWLIPMMALWANLHASFIVGIALAAAFAIEAMIEGDEVSVTLRSWLLVVLSAIAALATPHGFEGLIFPLKLNAIPALQFVGEWQASDLSRLQPFEVGLAVILYVVATRRIRLGVVRTLLLVSLAYLAFVHARHQMLLAMIAPLLLAEPLGAAFATERPSSRLSGVFATACGLAIACVAVARLVLPMVVRDGIAAPVTAMAHVPSDVRREPVLNDYAFGGYLIFENVRPFIDSRAELYGNNWLNRYAALERGPVAALGHTLDEEKIGWTILARGNPLVHRLDLLPGWRRVYTDKWAVVHARIERTGRNAALANDR